jgi:hypothetical protein
MLWTTEFIYDFGWNRNMTPQDERAIHSWRNGGDPPPPVQGILAIAPAYMVMQAFSIAQAQKSLIVDEF